MKVFVWKYVQKLTDSYHSGGGLVAFAETEERARELAIAAGVVFSDEPPEDVRSSEGVEAVHIFPDAGCC